VSTRAAFSSDSTSAGSQTGEPVVGEDVGGHPIGGRCLHAGLGQDLPDDGSPVGSVLAQRLARPVPRDLDTAATQPEVLPVVGL
jgi:hypothetical protein